MAATKQKAKAKAKPKEKNGAPALGKVASLGPKETWQVPLLIPNGWDDLTNPITDFSGPFVDGQKVLLRGRMPNPTRMIFSPRAKMIGAIVDNRGFQIKFSCFGDSRELESALAANASDLVLYGTLSVSDRGVFLQNFDMPNKRWIGRLRPVYPGKPKVIKSESVRERIGPFMREAIPVAAQFLEKELLMSGDELLRFSDSGQFSSMTDLLIAAHYPKSQAAGEAAHRTLTLMAGYRAVLLARSQGEANNAPPKALPAGIDEWRTWAAQIPFTLSPKQVLAVESIVADFSGSKVMRRLLSGDVGYGKTAVFGVAAATMYGSGGRVCIMLPNETLAEQCFRELSGYWPSAAPDMRLVTGSKADTDDLSDARWLIGTTALLFRDPGEFHLVIVDEQQKFSREQRMALVTKGTHLLEATATCIPRSQALIQFGGFDYTILDEPPVPRFIKTDIRYHFDRKQLFDDVKANLARGEQVLIVYPRRAAREDEEEGSSAISDVEAAAAAWERFAPGMVRLAHGGRTEEQNNQALLDMREGRASILVATTVVEVGVNIPKLRRTIIVEPHRFGLSTLHQIRGRTARTGGEGACDLYIAEVPQAHSLDRLSVLTRTQNGFEIAMEDLRIRGCGNLSADSNQQTGADDTIIFGRPLTPDMLQDVVELEKKWSQS